MLKIKAEGLPWNHKRVRRIYCDLGLNIRVKPRKRIPKGEAKILVQPIQPNRGWSADFMSDTLDDGRRFRTFKEHNILLQYTQTGKPAQNGFVERFNRSFRTEILDITLFRNLMVFAQQRQNKLSKNNGGDSIFN